MGPNRRKWKAAPVLADAERTSKALLSGAGNPMGYKNSHLNFAGNQFTQTLTNQGSKASQSSDNVFKVVGT